MPQISKRHKLFHLFHASVPSLYFLRRRTNFSLVELFLRFPFPIKKTSNNINKQHNDIIQILPALFLSHGAPTTILPSFISPIKDLWKKLGTQYQPKGIVCISAHWQSTLPDAAPQINGSNTPPQIYDFYGFPKEMYSIKYAAKGDAELAKRVQKLLQPVKAQLDNKHGLDHGTWVPMFFVYPEANIPIVQVSLVEDDNLTSQQNMAKHVALGKLLAPLRREDILIVCSGGEVHNLGDFNFHTKQVFPWAAQFQHALQTALKSQNAEQHLCNYRKEFPQAQRSHPSEEHFLPLAVAYGAGCLEKEQPDVTVLYDGIEFGSLALGTFKFE